MSLLITDPDLAKRVIAEREATDGTAHDEVWNGVYVMSPLPNMLHQLLVSNLVRAFASVVDEAGGDRVFPGVNVSDRDRGWKKNFRAPDVVVILHDNPGKDCGTHWRGGPDLVVEILSPGDRARAKRRFYASVGVRELLIVGRYPWELELYRLLDGSLDLVGKSTLDDNESIASAILPIRMRIVPDQPRPMIEITDTLQARCWTV